MTQPESIPILDSVERSLSRVFEVYLPAMIFPFLLHRFMSNNSLSRLSYDKLRRSNEQVID